MDPLYDPYEVETTSDEEVECQRQEIIRKKIAEKKKGKKSAYGTFVPKGDIGRPDLTVEEIENFEGIVAGNYKPLTSAPAEETSAYGAIPSEGNAYGSLPTTDGAYGSIELATEGGGSYGAYSVPGSIIAQREELKNLTKDERESRIRYEAWSKEREKRDFSLFEKTQRSQAFKTEKKIKSWNQAFLEAQDLPEDTPDEHLKKYRLLSKLSTDFIEIAKVYGRTVISEYFLNKNFQTVETIKIGGVAGGTKYIVRGILFKLAVDPAIGKTKSHFVYGGKTRNFEYAAKAAGHELKGAINMHKYYKISICVPMQALVDYHGYSSDKRHDPRSITHLMFDLQASRTIIMELTKDQEKTIHHDDPHFNECMRGIAQDLHLGGHHVCDEQGVEHHIYAAGDIEGHIGTDGRYYLIDLARAFPPESMWDTHHLHRPSQAVFFRMLRPEFLQWLKKSSRDSKEHNDRVREATNILINKVVPEFAATFVQRTPRQLRDIQFDNQRVLLLFQVSEELHRNGINVRHMGLVRFMIRDTDDSSVAAKDRLLISMVGRTLKNLLRREMRVEHVAHK
eukprot:jgi/Bigna1/78392/fgenesh1_pg.54_\